MSLAPHREVGRTHARARAFAARGVPAVVLLALSFGGTEMHPVTPPAGTWVITSTNIEVLASIDAELTEAFFDGPQTVALGGYADAVAARGWASLASFRADVDAGSISDDVRTVMYDPEAWEHTPLAEQVDPVGAMAEFAQLAWSSGYQVLMTPHPSLVTVPSAACRQRSDETVPAAFVRCGLPAAAARSADIVDLQLQALQQDPDRYPHWIAVAAHQARQANPRVKVLAHVTTLLAPEPTVLYSAWRSVQPIVDGCYLGVPGGARARVAIRFLRMISIGADRRR